MTPAVFVFVLVVSAMPCDAVAGEVGAWGVLRRRRGGDEGSILEEGMVCTAEPPTEPSPV